MSLCKHTKTEDLIPFQPDWSVQSYMDLRWFNSNYEQDCYKKYHSFMLYSSYNALLSSLQKWLGIIIK